MKIKVTRPVNNGHAEFEIDDRDDKRALEQLIFLTVNDYCSNCKSTSIVWDSNRSKDDKGQEFLYIKRRCLSCGATSTAGSYGSGGFFWKKFEVYNGNVPSGNKNATSTPQNGSNAYNNAPHPADDVNIDDIPF